MKTLKLTLAAALAFCGAITAQALTITAPLVLPPSGDPLWYGNDNSNLDAAAIANIVGATSLTLAYKQDVGSSSDSGTFSGSYKTTFSNTATDPSDAFIDYKSGPMIPTTNAYLYVKDGAQSPAYYIYNLTALGWDGGDIYLEDFWPNNGAISNIAIYTGPGTSVPDGGATAILLGFGLLGTGLIARKTQLARIS